MSAAETPRIAKVEAMLEYHATREEERRGVRRRLFFRSDAESEGEDDAASQEATIPDLSLSPAIITAMGSPDPVGVAFAHRVADAAPIDWSWLSTLNNGQH
jgi:hypothetical protein